LRVLKKKNNMNLTEKYLGLELTEQETWRSFFEGLIFESYSESISENFEILESDVIKETQFYILKKEKHQFESDEAFYMESAYSVVDGSYIGDKTMAKFLEKKEIIAQAIDESHKVASIGFSEKTQEWFGWSHRAIYGFKEGMKIKKGSLAYMPKNEKDFMDEMIRFFTEDIEVVIVTKTKLDVKDPNGDFQGTGIFFEYEYPNINNEIIRSTHFAPYPETFGKGEYTIENKEQAKETAINFANSVA